MTVEYLALGLGGLSLLMSLVAVGIAISSDRRMKALSNLEFQEKLSVMAGHLRTIEHDKSCLRAEQILNDFESVSCLKNYTSKEKQEKLIRDYAIPILKEYLSGTMESGVAITVNEMIDIALSYHIKSTELENLRQCARRMR